MIEIKFRDISVEYGNGLVSAWIDGEQVGSLSFGYPTSHARHAGKYDIQIGQLLVIEGFRRRGVGSQLLDRFYAETAGKRVVPAERSGEGELFMQAYAGAP